MKLIFHGGKCCGIKTIYDLGISPSFLAPELPAIELNNSDIHYHDVSSNQRFFHEAAPEETLLARLDRYIEYCRRRRPQHLIEIVLAKGAYCDQKAWYPVLEERGFKRVSSTQNSNSGNILHVYHLCYDVPAEEAAERKRLREEKKAKEVLA